MSLRFRRLFPGSHCPYNRPRGVAGGLRTDFARQRCSMVCVPASILIGEREWLWPSVAVLVVLAAIVAATYIRSGWSAVRRSAAIALKITGLALLLACLSEPLWSGTRV